MANIAINNSLRLKWPISCQPAILPRGGILNYNSNLARLSIARAKVNGLIRQPSDSASQQQLEGALACPPPRAAGSESVCPCPGESRLLLEPLLENMSSCLRICSTKYLVLVW